MSGSEVNGLAPARMDAHAGGATAQRTTARKQAADATAVTPHEAAAGRRVLVLGGTSEIALAIVRALQSRAPREIVLVGRDLARLGEAASGLRAAGCAPVSTLELDAIDVARHEQVVARGFTELGGSADVVIVAVGVLGERGALPDELNGAVRTLQVNLVGAGSLLMCATEKLRAQGHGSIVVLSSVAAERPRRANAVYGASKAGLDALAQGLGDELRDHGVQVLVVRPGFVRTRMTSGLDPAPLASTPEAVAQVVIAGLDSGRHTVWAPPALRWLMGRAEAAASPAVQEASPVSATDPVDVRTLELQARRHQAREARRRTRLARIDLGLGVLAALVLLMVSPGGAMTAIVAAIALLVCLVSLAAERRGRRRGKRRR